MKLPQPETGLVIQYEYLWHTESLKGQEHGLKARPCAIVLAEENGVVTVVPITHTPPKEKALAIEIPAKTRTRLGLDAQPCWVICAEVNEFAWPGSDLRPIKKSNLVTYGLLPPALYDMIMQKFADISGRKFNNVRKLKIVKRT